MNSDKIRKIFLSKEETEQRCQMVLNFILQECQPHSIILFGSAAINQLTASSDIDVVTVVHEKQQVKKTLHQLYSKSSIIPFPVDFLVIDQATYHEKANVGGLFFDVYQTGIILYPSH